MGCSSGDVRRINCISTLEGRCLTVADCAHQHAHSTSAKRLTAALVVISVFMVVEVVGGIISGSLALLADAAHMLTDAFALALAVSAHWISARPADKRLHFGYRRTQVLAAFVNGVALIGLLFWIVFEAVHRMANPVAVSWQPMLMVAIIGLAANGVAFWLLHSGDRENINMRGAILHVVSDLLGSVAAVIAALVIAFGGPMRVDPILSIVVAALIAQSAIRLLRETGHILLEGAPKDLDVDQLAIDLKSQDPAIEDIHNVQVWQLTPEQLCITLHARIAEKGSGSLALAAIKARLESKYGILDSTVQIELDKNCPDGGTTKEYPQTQREESVLEMPGAPAAAAQ